MKEIDKGKLYRSISSLDELSFGKQKFRVKVGLNSSNNG